MPARNFEKLKMLMTLYPTKTKEHNMIKKFLEILTLTRGAQVLVGFMVEMEKATHSKDLI